MKLNKNLNKTTFFFILQCLIILFAFFAIQSNLFAGTDISMRGFLTKTRNNIIKSFFGDKYQKNLNQIVLIGIDDNFFRNENLAYQGLHRGYYAKALENLNKANPNMIGIDVLFETGYNFTGGDSRTNDLNKVFSSFDSDLVAQLKNNIILASILDKNNQTIKKPSEKFITNGVKLGNANYFENKTKNTFLGVYTDIPDGLDKIFPLSMMLYANAKTNIYKEKSEEKINFGYEIKKFDNNIIRISTPGENLDVPYISEGGEDYIFTPLYFYNETLTGNSKQINFISFDEIYKGTFDAEKVKDKIVLIGATDRISIYDIKNTFYGQIPGVLLHANQLLGFLNKDFIFKINTNETLLIVIGFLVLNIMIISFLTNKKNYGYIFFALILETLIIIIGGVFLSFAGYFNFSWLKYSIFMPLGTILTILLSHTVISFVYTLWDVYGLKENFKKLFQIYTGENILTKNLDDENNIGKRESEEKNTALFFSDIANYTKICESLNPKESIDMLNIYLDYATQSILGNKGKIDKYLGDGIMAFWEESKNACDLAAKASVQSIKSLKEVNSKIKKNLGINDDDLIKIRIGLHYGKTIVGDIGPERVRLNYTVIGDSVNLASRLESINKHYGTSICISGDFRDNIKRKSDFIVRKLDRIRVKGKENPIEIYELYPIDKNYITNESNLFIDSFIKTFQEGLEEYFLGNFKEAIDLFNNAKDIVQEKSTDIFLKRCEFLLSAGNDLKNWDGIWTFYEK